MESEKFPKPDEFTRLFTRLPKAVKDDQRKADCCFLAGAGLRVAETMAIRVEATDLGKAHLHIRSANAKLKRARTVVLHPPVIEALQEYLAGISDRPNLSSHQ